MDAETERESPVAAEVGRVGEVPQAACIAGLAENSDGSRDQAGDGNV